MTNSSAPAPMCDDCKALVGASRSTKPHENLEYKNGRQVSSMMGAADEAYYRCRVCGHEWLRPDRVAWDGLHSGGDFRGAINPQ